MTTCMRSSFALFLCVDLNRVYPVLLSEEVSGVCFARYLSNERWHAN